MIHQTYLLLGVVNDCADCMEGEYGPATMSTCYEMLGLRKGQMCGGNQFTGPNCDALLKEETLSELQMLLGDSSQDYIRYLASIREMNSIMVRTDLPEDYSYEAVVQEFQEAFENVHLRGISETPKVHIMSQHVLEYINNNGVTLATTSDEAVETCHQRYQRRDQLFNSKVIKNLTSKFKQKKSNEAINHFNGLNRNFKEDM